MTVSTLAGDDQVSSSPLGALPLKVTVDGGSENDTYRADDTNDPHTYHVEVRWTDGSGNQQGLSEGGCVPE